VAAENRAQENRGYIRALLKKKQPEFAALLDWPDWDVPCRRGQDTMCAEPATNSCP
jgi:hypothetical protein